MNWRTLAAVRPAFQLLCLLVTTQTLASPSADRSTSLSRETAATRSRQVSQINYKLWFGIDAESNEFRGRTEVQFNLKPKAKDQSKKIALDLEDGTLQSIKVNGSDLDDLKNPERFDGHHIFFKLSELQSTANKIEITYTHLYSTDGTGLHRFKDPVDNQVYLYTQFEPYDAHRLFPCFDQPDLKATFELSVEAPTQWQVISATLPKEPQTTANRQSWTFPRSAVFSTYLFSLHAGPYAVWKDNTGEIPLRLFARKSLAKYVDHQEWLKVTKNGLNFFNLEFGYPYPFGKYDQIIVPDFNAGAMENVAAITFSERYVYRTRVTQDRKRGRAETILHEMAHMWFGDLVTMKWWNGLWLNESFATFMSTLAGEKAENFQDSWLAFFTHEKLWAYWEDQLVTTHPIELPVPDTDHASAIFDGITYGKGASVLKELAFYLGEDDFREGLQRYFLKYAFKNTSLSDFFKMLAEASSKDLNSWQQSWLQTTGFNTVRPTWECAIDPKKGKLKISKFELTQTGEPLRTHRTQIGFFNFPKGQNRSTAQLIAGKPIDVIYKDAKTEVAEAIGLPCPDFVFPNFQDHDYVKTELDPLSQKIALKQLSQITDPLTRAMIWHDLWQMVIDGNLATQDYAETVLKHLPHEKNSLILSKVLQTLVNSSSNSSSVLKFLDGDLRSKYRHRFETFIKNHLLRATAGSDTQLIWYQAFLEVAESRSMTQFAKALFDGKQKLKAFPIDQERRWELLLLMARTGAKGIQEQIASELENDPTDLGSRYAIAAESLIPNESTKAKWLAQIFGNVKKTVPTPRASPAAVVPEPSPGPSVVVEAPQSTQNFSLAKIREAMMHYHTLDQEEFTRKSVDLYFKALPEIAESSNIEDEEYAKWLAKMMFPSLCDPLIVQKTTALLDSHPHLSASIIKTLKIGRQEEERCIRARAKVQGS